MKRTIYIILPLALCACKPSIPFQTAVNKADSCYMAQDYRQANKYYKQAFKASDVAPQNYHYSNAAGVAAMDRDEQTAFMRLNQLVEKDKEW